MTGTEALSVSVVIPTFNRAEYLNQALLSALSQVPEPSEVIVADHGSTDGTEALLESFPFVRHLRVPRNEWSGPAQTRNAGLKESTSDLVAFLDDDDVWLPDKLAKQMHVFREHPTVTLCCSDAKVVDQSGKEVRPRYLPPALAKKGFASLAKANWVVSSSAVARRDSLIEIGGFNEDPRLRAEDYELWLRIAARWRVHFIDEPLIEYRLHSESISSGQDEHRLRMAALRFALLDPGVRQMAAVVYWRLFYEWGRSLKSRRAFV